MDVKQLAFRKAAAMLSAIGAEYAIVYGGVAHTSNDLQYAIQSKDGNTHGPLAIEKTVKERTPQRSWAYTGYSAAILALAVGEAWKYTTESVAEARGLQGAVTGSACKLWGAGNYMTSVTGTTLELLRLG